ncbi:3-oxoacyl-ACP reductase FabG [Oceanobacillus halophilus]|uniref:Glucose 1-dehydrogenase n=1 Tax=Oceanobacillus halophilus TaxID=930130 RepID=A0A495ABH5_9BACI|nr:3-oxoacyl-ACP reductase FabG [Oceanobacillus halophilus]RKQ35776.1 glucose 1-dehydrogenase [Oceanobacillus halophilus]
MSRFENKTAIVTGGSRGIGLEIVKTLLADGAKVAILDINEEELANCKEALARFENSIVTYKTDVSSGEDANNAINNVVKEFGKLDILINNAGITRDNMLFKMTDSDWDSVMSVHLNGAFNMSRAAQKHMVDNNFGRIINISSVSALGNRGQANYATAKAGLQGFTKTLAIELGKFGITSNAIAPGFIETDMTKATAERMGLSFEEYRKLLVQDIPVQRSGNPKDIANAVSFLADEDSSFINGQVLYVAGGPTV